jgi:hypothetical protein
MNFGFINRLGEYSKSEYEQSHGHLFERFFYKFEFFECVFGVEFFLSFVFYCFVSKFEHILDCSVCCEAVHYVFTSNYVMSIKI